MSSWISSNVTRKSSRELRAMSIAMAFFAAGLLLPSAAFAGTTAVDDCLAGGDFNGDGKGDLIYRGVSGGALNQIYVQMLDGTTIAGQGFFSEGGGAWVLNGTGDTNDDGRTDLVYLGSGAGAGYWQVTTVGANGDSVSGTGYIGNGSGAWELFDPVGCTTVEKTPDPSVKDLNGDGRADLIAEGAAASAGDGFWRVQIMNSAGTGVDDTGYYPTGGGAWGLSDASADYNGDGQSDLLAEGIASTPAAGFLKIIISNAAGTGASATAFLPTGGGAWVYGTTGDLNGDTRDDIISVGTAGSGGDGFAKLTLMNSDGTGADSTAYLDTGGGAWSPVGVAKMNDDDYGDILWMGVDGTSAEGILKISIMSSDGTTVSATGFVASGAGYEAAGIVDTNGDERGDVIFESTADTKISITDTDGVSFSSTATVTNGAGAWDLFTDD